MNKKDFFSFDESWNLFENLKEDLSLLEQFFKKFEGRQKTSFVLSPNIDIYEKNNNLIVEADLPGFKPEDIEIELKNNNLTIRAETKEEKEQQKENFWQKERHHGIIQRTIALPVAVDNEKVEAKFKNGVLKIILPKKEKAKSIKINIKEEEQ